MFLSLALAWAEVLGACDICIGANALDYSGYPDCRPEYLAAFERLAALATRAGVEGARFRVHAPLLHMTKAEIVRAGPGTRPRLRSDAQLLRSRARRPPVRTLRQLRAPRQRICGGGGTGSAARVMHNAQCTMQTSKSLRPLRSGAGPFARAAPGEPFVHCASCLTSSMTQRLYYTDAVPDRDSPPSSPRSLDVRRPRGCRARSHGVLSDVRRAAIRHRHARAASALPTSSISTTAASRTLSTAPLAPGATVRGQIDWGRRFDHMQQHTGQHVLSAAFDRVHGARP